MKLLMAFVLPITILALPTQSTKAWVAYGRAGYAHVGYVRNYIIGDVMARTKRLRGFNVLHPFGWDAFGLPAENAAIKTGTPPEQSPLDNIAHMKGQLQRLGISYDWAREIATCLPEYYQFNQWIFLKMLERGLAYRKRSTVNWCPSCQTVLANEQVVDGACWRCGTTVVTRELANSSESDDSITSSASSNCASVMTSGMRTRITLLYEPAFSVITPRS